MNYNELEEKRKKLARSSVFGGLGIGLGILSFVGTQFLENSAYLVVIGFALFIVGGALSATASAKLKRLNTDIKKCLIPELLKEILGDNVAYMANAGLSELEVCSSRLVVRRDRFHSEDLIVGQYEDVNIKTSDVVVEERHETHTKSGTQVTYVPTFVGRFFKLRFTHHIDGCVTLGEGELKASGLEKVKLESIEFNKKFKIFANNEHNAFFILTPHVMEAIMAIEAKYNGKIGVQFEGDEVMVAINNGVDTFNVSMYKKIDEEYINSFKAEISCITDLIKAIKVSSQYKGE